MKEIKVSGNNYGKPSSLGNLGIDESIRQDINSKVIGIFNYNNKIREKLLNKNIGLYELSNVNTVINNISNVYSNLSSKPFPYYKEGLLGYTHIVRNDYQTSINKKYDIGEYIEYYVNKNNLNDVSLKWNGKYDDYTEYMSNLLNIKISTFSVLKNIFKNNKIKNSSSYQNDEEDNLNILSVINDFLQYDNIKYAMEKTRIGTINPNPLAALTGAITTNISNYSGKDSSLGMITNQLYAFTLRNGSQFNSLRNTKYITPEAYKNIGNKLHTLSTLSSDFRIDDETGRLSYDFGFDGGADTIIIDRDSYEWLDKFQREQRYSGDHIFLPLKEIRDNMLSLNIKKYKGKEKGYTPYSTYKANTQISTYNKSWDEDGIIGDNEKYIYPNNNDSVNANLLDKTFDFFKNKRINTLINRFYITNGRDDKYNEKTLFQTAINSEYGISHGRNLLSTVSTNEHGYENPYCRVWTWHHQYNNLDKLIRSYKFNKDFQSNWELHGRREGSTGRLELYSTLNKNGFPNITPISSINDNNNSQLFEIDTKKCMFSIENLAWKDYAEHNLSYEQIGPNGGRIMWFPPYDLKFNEQIGVNWSPNDFIGRGERVYTYTNTERTGTLSFKLLVDHPSLVDMWMNYGENKNNETDDEQTLLRFFAGCDKLDLKTKYEQSVSVEKKVDEIKWEEEYVKGDDIIFYIFFPNNYTGIDENLEDSILYLTEEYDTKKLNTPIYDKYKWCYRVDEAYLDEPLRNLLNYTEFNYYNLNDKFEDNEFYTSRCVEISDATTCFKDVLTKDFSNIIVTDVEIKAHASSVGNNNDKIINNRYKYAKNVLFDKLKLDSGLKIKEEKTIIDIGKDPFITNISHKTARSCKIILHTKIKKTIDFYFNEYESYLKKNMNDIIRNAINNISFTGKTEEIMSKYTINDWFQDVHGEEFKIGENDTILKKSTPESKSEFNGEMQPTEYRSKSFDNESIYFKLLEKNDPITYKRITDKIKYFSPAFHSITPEGFNARLGFLHQCTRQGPTYSSSDDTTFKSAGNLAFGRPPICVLRIGDFYNTKIIIETVSIDYETQQWDMNPEGIGMQPTFASVTLNFKFLGGSDLETPISRLQNALSFNYYANQSIYDKRSDITSYDIVNNKINYNTLWIPK